MRVHPTVTASAMIAQLRWQHKVRCHTRRGGAVENPLSRRQHDRAIQVDFVVGLVVFRHAIPSKIH